jgi:6-phosphogluconolactonase
MTRHLARILIAFFVLLLPAAVNVQAAGSGYLYVLRNVSGGPNQIYGFQVNELTGALSALGGFPVDTGGTGSAGTVSEQMVYDPANRRLFVLNGGSFTIIAYNVNLSTGALETLPFSPIDLSPGTWNCLVVHPTGSPLIAGNGEGQRLASFTISGAGATAAAGSPFATTVFPFSSTFSRDGHYIYSGGNFGTDIGGFSVDAGTGIITGLAGSPFNSGALFPVAYTADSAGRLFVSNINANQVRVFTTSAGSLSPVLNNPFVSGLTNAVHGVLHPAGFYLVADRGDNRVGVFRITGSGFSTLLSPVTGSPFASGGLSTSILALNQSGSFLFAANANSRNITSYAVSGATGHLTGVFIQPSNTAGNTGSITGMAYVPGLSRLFLPLIKR